MSKRPIRILFVTQSCIFSGAEVNLVALLSTFDMGIIRPYLCYNPLSGLGKELDREGIGYFPFEFPQYRRKNLIAILLTQIRLLVYLLKSRIDVVYVNVGSGAEIRFFEPVCHLLNIPIILHLHIHEDDISLRWAKVNKADRILFPSNATLEAVLSTSPWIDRSKCFYVHNAIDLKRYHVHPVGNLRSDLGISDECRILGIFGQLKGIKGQHLFLEMAEKLSSDGIKVAYLIVGSDTDKHGEYENQLRQAVSAFGLENDVHFLGFRRDVPELMSLCDLVIVPSLREPFGRVVIEAMGCGTPVVASSVGGIVEIFKDGDGGLFCRPDDVEDLTAKVRFFFDHPDWWQEQARKALGNVQASFAQERHTKLVEQHVFDLL